MHAYAQHNVWADQWQEAFICVHRSADDERQARGVAISAEDSPRYGRTSKPADSFRSKS